MGWALARAAAARGAEVTLVAANVTLPAPAGVEVEPVAPPPTCARRSSTAAAGRRRRGDGGRAGRLPPARRAETKIKKSGESRRADPGAGAEHRRAGRAGRRPGRVDGGDRRFRGRDRRPRAAARARPAKLARKGCDLLVLNEVGGGQVFGAAGQRGRHPGADGVAVDVPRAAKAALAHHIWDEVHRRLGRSTRLPHLLRERPMHPEMPVHHLRRLISLTPHAGQAPTGPRHRASCPPPTRRPSRRSV